ncbi:hypothetical protein GQ53DRAFT_246784 [Thozetella sp. PMI_491]|nr:hypothetical protein GQ53DRAFT_246784 [Thozetella sp. PMI_491]
MNSVVVPQGDAWDGGVFWAFRYCTTVAASSCLRKTRVPCYMASCITETGWAKRMGSQRRPLGRSGVWFQLLLLCSPWWLLFRTWRDDPRRTDTA